MGLVFAVCYLLRCRVGSGQSRPMQSMSMQVAEHRGNILLAKNCDVHNIFLPLAEPSDAARILGFRFNVVRIWSSS